MDCEGGCLHRGAVAVGDGESDIIITMLIEVQYRNGIGTHRLTTIREVDIPRVGVVLVDICIELGLVALAVELVAADIGERSVGVGHVAGELGAATARGGDGHAVGAGAAELGGVHLGCAVGSPVVGGAGIRLGRQDGRSARALRDVGIEGIALCVVRVDAHRGSTGSSTSVAVGDGESDIPPAARNHRLRENRRGYKVIHVFDVVALVGGAVAEVPLVGQRTAALHIGRKDVGCLFAHHRFNIQAIDGEHTVIIVDKGVDVAVAQSGV